MKSLLELLYLRKSQWSDTIRKGVSDDLQNRFQRVADLSEKKNDENGKKKGAEEKDTKEQ